MEETKGKAKFRLNTPNGIVEIEGTEEFIQENIEKWSTLIAGAVPKARDHSDEKKYVSTKSKKRSASAKNSPLPKLISTLIPKDKILELQDIVAKKNPTNQSEAYTVIAYWIKYNLDLTSISIDEVWTVYKILGRKGPKEWLQVFRDTKSKLGWLDSVKDQKGRYYITPMGEQVVEHDLPRKKQSDGTT